MFCIRSRSLGQKEGTMLITEFSHREQDGGACGMEPNSLHSPGSLVAGPRTLRPERLRWLTTPAVNRQARGPGASAPERCGARKSSHCDRPGMLHAQGGHRAIWSSGRSATRSINAAPGTGLWPFFSEISQRQKSATGHPLRFSCVVRSR